MAAKKRRKKSSSGGGLSPQTFGGLSKKRMKKKSNPNAGMRIPLKKGESVLVQFLTDPDDPEGFREFEQHTFQEDGRWQFVPYSPNAPLAEDDNDSKRSTSYRFVAVVYDLKERKVRVLEGPKDLAQRIFYRYEKRPEKFRKRVFEVTKFPTQPVSYQVDMAEERPVNTSKMEPVDLEEYLIGEMKRYYGEEFDAERVIKGDALDDDMDFEDDEFELDDDSEWEDDSEWDDEDEEFLDDEDEDSEWEEDSDWDEDEEEEEEEPPRKKKSSSSSKKKRSKTSSSSARRRRRR